MFHMCEEVSTGLPDIDSSRFDSDQIFAETYYVLATKPPT